jgi:class 3 adenylate cyclase
MNATGMSRVTVAIVLMDIVGSMRLIAEIGDLEFLKLFQKYSERVGYAAQQHNGIIVKTMGDAVLLIFRDVSSAVPFVSELSNSLVRDPSAVLQLIEEPRVFHRNDCLRRKILQQRDLLFGEWPHLLSIDADSAQQLIVFAERYRRQGAHAAAFYCVNRSRLARTIGDVR